LVVSMFAYVISRSDFKYRRPFAFFVFFTMLFNGGMVPSYIINVNVLHLNDTIWALILPMLVNGFYIMVMRTFYATTISPAILDAAKIDGAGEFRTFFNIVVPLSKPAFATVGLFTVIGYWNDWMLAMLYITDQKLAPVQYTLMKVQNNLEFVKQSAKYLTSVEGMQLAMNTPTDSAQMALTALVVTPLLIAYPFFQKYFVKGLTIGGVKE
ncbi:MAG: carbohydrate ABC transporter permease, partial [Ruthenibacterium sp.]